MKHSSTTFNPKAISEQYNNTRNICIIAHIDAGKTTVTERILYYTGKIRKVGEVHEGETTTDHLKQERERGITIVSASVQVQWNDTIINIIDTPGHLDFNIEVERCLSVIEGCCVIIDSSAGVEPQTECVWRQADKFNISRLVFLNKMDKAGASFEKSLQSLRSKLSKNCVYIQFPIYNENQTFIGFFDLVNKAKYLWEGRSHKYEKTEYEDFTEEEKEIFSEHRTILIESLSDNNEQLMNDYLDEIVIEDSRIESIIRQQCADMEIFPVLCGTAFHNKGVQNLLDGICNYLPRPDNIKVETVQNQEKQIIDHHAPKLLCFAFKLIHDSYAGAVAYTRIYSGSITSGMTLFNHRTKKTARVQSIIRFYSNSRETLQIAHTGDIIGLVIEDALTGDILTEEVHKNAITMDKIEVPEPIINLSVTPVAKADQDRFAKYITQYLNEDPTIKLSYNQESKETILSGVGKLQLEVLISRLKSEKDINLKYTKPKVAYRETITKSITKEYLHKKQTGGAGQFAGVTLVIEPIAKGFEFHDKIVKGAIPKQYIPEVLKAIKDCLSCGINHNSPIVGISVSLIDGRYHSVDSSQIAYYLATKYCLQEMLKEADPILLEPIVDLVIHTPEAYLNNVVGDIYSKSGVIISINKDQSSDNDVRIITAELALCYIFDYAEALRGQTQGRGSCTYKFSKYIKCNTPPKTEEK